MDRKWTLGVTGSPGTGKKSVSPTVAGSLSARLIDINGVAFTASGSRSVDVASLRRALLRLDLSRTLLFGHLLPEVLRKKELSFVAVLRCEPSVLKARLLERGYGHEKVIENVEAELIGVVLDASLRAFGEDAVHEYDATSASPGAVARQIAEDFTRDVRAPADWLDWTLRYDSSARLRSLLSGPRTEPAST